MFPGKINNQRGVTLIELSIAIVISGIIFLGLFILINNMTKGIWTLGGDLELTGQASEAMYLIGNDFRNAKASTMGDVAQNQGFEVPPQLGAAPTGWAVLPADVTRVGADIKSGLISIKISNAATYSSDQFNIPLNKNFVLSGWIKGQGRLNLIRASDNADITGLLATGNNYWTHVSSTVVFGANQTAKLKLSKPPVPPGWTECTMPAFPASGLDKDVTEMVSYKNRVYVGGWENGETFSFSGTTGVYEGSIYYGINQPGRNPHMTTLGVFDPDGPGPRGEELLFCCGYWNFGNATSWKRWQIFYNDGSGSGWNAGWPTGAAEYPTYTNDDNGEDNFDPNVFGFHFFRCGVVDRGKLYVGTSGWSAHVPPFRGEVRVYDPTIPVVGGKWITTPPFPFVVPAPDIMVTALAVYNDKLYIGTATWYNAGTWHTPWGTGNVYVYDILTNTMVAGGASQQNTGWVRNMVVFNGGSGNKLYIAASDLYTFDGTWLPSIRPTPGIITAVCVYNNKLYIGDAMGNIYSSVDGINFVPTPGLGQEIRRFCVNDGMLYAGVSDNGWGNPRVFVWGVDEVHFDDISISPEQVVFDSSTVVNGVDNVYTYYTSKGNTEGDYIRFKLYRLRYNTPTRKLFREASTDGGVTWRPRGLQNDGVICENVKSFRIINHNQESFEVELVLEKRLPGGKTKKYKTRTTLKPEIS